MLLEGRMPRVHVQGEIANWTSHRSGHWYFSLKDRHATVRAVMFGSDNRLVRFSPSDGMQVAVIGRVSLYEPSGQFQLMVSTMEPFGDGALAAAYEALKARLEAEGLFAEARKKPLPVWPRCVGIVTSADGAALSDVLTVLRRRAPSVNVLICPARVQGAGAALEVAKALRQLDRSGCADVIIVGRGGGSAEDLSTFNDEALARSVAACKVPVVSAVGHETDVTICDWVADKRAPTPSAAAEMVVPDVADALARMESWAARLHGAAQGRVNGARLRLMRAERRLPVPQAWLQGAQQGLDGMEERARDALERLVRARRGELGAAHGRLGAAHPMAQLRAHRQHLDALRLRLMRGAAMSMEGCRRHANGLSRRLTSFGPRAQVSHARARVAGMDARLRVAAQQRVFRERRALEGTAGRLHAFSPLGVLSRGYALVTRQADGRLLRAVEDAPTGEYLRVRLSWGSLGVTSAGPLLTVMEVPGRNEGKVQRADTAQGMGGSAGGDKP
jgi:exodeoxyribonuclease VII large subunit